MKKITSSLFHWALTGITCWVANQGGLQAQTTVSTPIVGFQKISAPVGLSTLGFPLLNQDLLKSTASSVSGNTLNLSGQSNVGSFLSAGEPYYVEVYGGSLKGDRFDVDTAATIAAANGTVVLSAASGNNTFSVGSIATQLDGVTVALRKHITLEQVQQMTSAPLVGNNSASSADQIQLFDSSTGGYSSYYLRADGTTWRKVGTTTLANKTPVPPGMGVFVSKQSSPVEFLSSGTVRQNDFALPFKTGLQLLAPGFPLDSSPGSIGGTASNGWTGNNSATLADQIQVYNPASMGYESYYLRSDGTTWRKVGTTTVVTTDQLMSSGRAFFVSRQVADSSNILLNPITP